MTPPEPSLEAFIAGQHRRDRWVYLLLGHYLRREGTATWRRLVASTRFLGMPCAELRAYVMELVGAGFVEPIFPGYNRRGTSYRWLLTAGPLEPAPLNPEPPPLAA